MLFPDKNAYRKIFTCNYFGTVLREFNFITMDGGRWYCPQPRISLIPFVSKRYFYFLNTSDEMVLYHFLSREAMCSYSPLDILSQYIPFFSDQNELSSFCNWLQNKKYVFETMCFDIKPQQLLFRNESFFEELITGKTIVQMLILFRLSKK